MSESSASHPDDLYTLPLEDFTEARDDLAQRLRSAGDEEGAATVSKIRKPSVAAWALNVAARDRPEVVERLVASHRRLREATSADVLREASQERRNAITELTAIALAQLGAAGRPASPTTHDRINSTLLAVATDRQAEEDLAAGRLLREMEPSGGGWEDIGLAPPPKRDARTKEKAAAQQARAKADRLAAEATKAAERLQQAERALSEATRRAEETRIAADLAETSAREAEEAAG